MAEFAENIKRHLFAGEYLDAQKLLEKHIPQQEVSDEMQSLRVAVCSQLGKSFEAEQFASYFLKNQRKPSKHAVFAAFYMSLGSIRISQYDKGRFWIAKSLLWSRWVKKNRPASSEENALQVSDGGFYAFQGIAFYKFFCGQFVQSKHYAQKAYIAAKASHDAYAIVLSLDLLAQSNYRLGHCNLALEEFKRAREAASEANFSKLESAIRISELLLQAQTGRLKDKTIDALREAMSFFSVDDIYSKNELLLELSQQLILCGRNSEARGILNSVSTPIYKVGHLRQAAVLNLRLAYSMYSRGEPESARALLLSHFSRLNEKTDRQLIQSYLGFFSMLDPQTDGESASEQAEEVTAKGLRICLRRGSKERMGASSSARTRITPPQRFEDPLGDLIDDTALFSEDTLNRICDSGYYSLIARMLQLKQGVDALIIDKAASRAFIVSAGDVIPTQSTLKPQILSLIQLFQGGEFVSKNSLCQFLWNSRYNPDRHEKSIQSAINRLKDFLSPRVRWLETSKDGFRISPSTEIIVLSSAPIQDSQPRKPLLDAAVAFPRNFNIRQLKFLRQPPPRLSEYFSSQEWADIFGVTLMTATRDLKMLCSQGLVVVSGRGRATRYRLSESTVARQES